MLGRLAGRGAVTSIVLILCTCAPANEETSRATETTGARPFQLMGLAVDPMADDEFGISLLRALSNATPGENVVVSPTSAGIALRMALEGAAGATRDSLRALLHLGANTALAAPSPATEPIAPSRADGVSLTIANAMWGRAGAAFDPAYVDRLRSAYAAEVRSVDLSSPQTVTDVNAWVSGVTKGRIPAMLEAPLGPDVMLLLVNAIHFKGRWRTEFEPAATRERPFHLPNGATRSVSMMTRTGDYQYYEADGQRAVRLPYQGDRFAMYVILADNPHARTMPTQLSAEWLRAAARAVRARPIELAMPRYKLEQTIDLKAPLVALGAGIAFDARRADFSRMLPHNVRPEQSFFIGRALQKTFIEVNEEGTEAAAATAIEMQSDSGSGPLRFIVDRPFWFAIRDDRTGALLFLGHVVDPG